MKFKVFQCADEPSDIGGESCKEEVKVKDEGEEETCALPSLAADSIVGLAQKSSVNAKSKLSDKPLKCSRKPKPEDLQPQPISPSKRAFSTPSSEPNSNKENWDSGIKMYSTDRKKIKSVGRLPLHDITTITLKLASRTQVDLEDGDDVRIEEPRKIKKGFSFAALAKKDTVLKESAKPVPAPVFVAGKAKNLAKGSNLPVPIKSFKREAKRTIMMRL